MSPEQAAREWLESTEYRRIATARYNSVVKLTAEQYMRGDPKPGMSVPTMRELFADIFIAGVKWGRSNP